MTNTAKIHPQDIISAEASRDGRGLPLGITPRRMNDDPWSISPVEPFEVYTLTGIAQFLPWIDGWLTQVFDQVSDRMGDVVNLNKTAEFFQEVPDYYLPALTSYLEEVTGLIDVAIQGIIHDRPAEMAWGQTSRTGKMLAQLYAQLATVQVTLSDLDGLPHIDSNREGLFGDTDSDRALTKAAIKADQQVFVVYAYSSDDDPVVFADALQAQEYAATFESASWYQLLVCDAELGAEMIAGRKDDDEDLGSDDEPEPKSQVVVIKNEEPLDGEGQQTWSVCGGEDGQPLDGHDYYISAELAQVAADKLNEIGF